MGIWVRSGYIVIAVICLQFYSWKERCRIHTFYSWNFAENIFTPGTLQTSYFLLLEHCRSHTFYSWNDADFIHDIAQNSSKKS